VKVIVSKHALDRARDRYRDRELAVSEITREVGAALRCDRIACHPPRPFGHQSTARTRGKGDRKRVRYAWNRDLTRCYVFQQVRDRKTGGPLVIVVTAINRNPLADAA
jgi:hypothetical protein